MSAKKPPPWQLPAIIAGSLAALTALGTFIVKSAKYIELPDVMAGVQEKNTLQDEAILELKKSNEIWQDIYTQQQQQAPMVPTRRLPLDYWTDEDGTCYQCDPNVSDCANSWDGWWRCDR